MTQKFIVLDQSGHTELNYAVNVENQRLRAQAQFERLIQLGYTAFSIGEEAGRKDILLTDFDPEVRTIVFTPRVVGG